LAPWVYKSSSPNYQAPGSVLSAANAPFPPYAGDYAFYITAQEGVNTNYFINSQLENIPVPSGGVLNCTIQLYINPSNPGSVVKYQPRLYITGAIVAGFREQEFLWNGIASTNGKWMTLGGLVAIPAGTTSAYAVMQIAKLSTGTAGNSAILAYDELVCYPISQCAA
jgi:hypothetical protein